MAHMRAITVVNLHVLTHLDLIAPDVLHVTLNLVIAFSANNHNGDPIPYHFTNV